jgi:hypothetical protein
VHPAARIGAGVLIDHGTSVVIGETAVVEDNVSILHEVTLGGTGNQSGDRHPKVRRGVLLGAGAKILGNIEVGRRLCLNSLTRHLLSNFEKIRLAPRPGLTGARSSALPAAAGESGRHIRCAPVISTLLPDTPTKDRFCESRCSRPHTRHTLSPGAWGRRSPPSPAKPPP